MKYHLVTTQGLVNFRYLVALEDDQDPADAEAMVMAGEVDDFEQEHTDECVIDNAELCDHGIKSVTKTSYMRDWSVESIKEVTPVARKGL